MHPVSTASILFATLLLVSCTTPAGPEHTVPGIDLPARWNSSAAGGTQGLPRTWWAAFRDSELNRLEHLALAASPDMTRALARVDEARATLRESAAARWPTLTASAAASRSQPAADSQQDAAFKHRRANTTYGLQTDLRYEFDLWGKVRRGIESSEATATATIYNGDAVRLRLTAQVAENYFIHRGLESEIGLLTDTLAIRQANIAFTEERRKGGLGSEVDVSRARAESAATRADLADLRRRQQLSLHSLAALCGQPAAGFSLKGTTHRIPVFIAARPATLLRQRPDVAEAERLVAARCADIGAAEANRLPSLTLGGSAGLENFSLSDLLSSGSRKFSFGPQLDIPLFTGGARRSRADRARALHAQAIADYRGSVINALKEVEDALANINGYAALDSDYTAAIAAARQTASLSRERYGQGVASYLEVIDAQRDLLSHQLRLIQNQSLQARASAQLAKALGGGGE